MSLLLFSSSSEKAQLLEGFYLTLLEEQHSGPCSQQEFGGSAPKRAPIKPAAPDKVPPMQAVPVRLFLCFLGGAGMIEISRNDLERIWSPEM